MIPFAGPSCSIGSYLLKSPSLHLNAPSQHLNAPSRHLNAPSQHLNAPSLHLKAPSQVIPGHPPGHSRAVQAMAGQSRRWQAKLATAENAAKAAKAAKAASAGNGRVGLVAETDGLVFFFRNSNFLSVRVGWGETSTLRQASRSVTPPSVGDRPPYRRCDARPCDTGGKACRRPGRIVAA